MAEPKPVMNENAEVYGVDGRPKGKSKKSEREHYLQKQVDQLKNQLNGQLDKVKALKQTFKDSMEKMRAVNDKLQEEKGVLVDKHDSRLIKYMELSDAFDELEREVNELRGTTLPEEDQASGQEGGETGPAEVLEEG